MFSTSNKHKGLAIIKKAEYVGVQNVHVSHNDIFHFLKKSTSL